MALSKVLPTDFGIDATYWKIVDLNINWLSREAHISLLGWSDKVSRELGKKELSRKIFSFYGEEFPFLDIEPQNEREIAYEYIKQTDLFTNSGDA